MIGCVDFLLDQWRAARSGGRAARTLRLLCAALLLTVSSASLADARSSYRSGNIRFDLSDRKCATQMTGVFRTRDLRKGVVRDSDPETIAATKEIVSKLLKQCPDVETIEYSYWGIRTRHSGSNFLRRSNSWETEAERAVAARAANERRRQLKADKKQELANWHAKAADLLDASMASYNPLKHRGYTASLRRFSGDAFEAYVATASPHRSAKQARWRLVFEHAVDESEPFLRQDQSIDDWQRYLDLADVPVAALERSVYHYVKGYQHPMDDPRAVQSPGHCETPLAVVELKYRRDSDGQLVLDGANRQDTHQGRARARQSLQRVSAVNSVEHARRVFTGHPKSWAVEQSKDQPELKPDGPSDRFLADEKRERDRAIRGGYVFKNEAYWSEFELREVQWFIDGTNADYTISGPVFMHVFRAYLEEKPKYCAASMGPTTVIPVMQTYRAVDGYGAVRWQDTRAVSRLNVELRFAAAAAYVSRYTPDSGPVAGEVRRILAELGPPPTLDGLEVKAYQNALRAALARDVRQLFELEQCDSPLLRQFEENLYRVVEKKPSVQATGLRIPGAQAATDPGVKDTAPTFVTSCLANFDFSVSRRVYCKCLHDVVERAYPESRIAEFTVSYRAFERELAHQRTEAGYGQRTPETQLYFKERACHAESQ